MFAIKMLAFQVQVRARVSGVWEGEENKRERKGETAVCVSRILLSCIINSVCQSVADESFSCAVNCGRLLLLLLFLLLLLLTAFRAFFTIICKIAAQLKQKKTRCEQRRFVTICRQFVIDFRLYRK